MAIQAGLVGLPNVGKSTLFNALTKSSVPAENYPFCTIDPHLAITEVPDPMLDKLMVSYGSQKKIPATVTFVDIAGLVKGAAAGEGLGNQFLNHIREVDLILHVLRCFENQDIIHSHGVIDPIADYETIVAELMLKDLDSVEKRLERLPKYIKTAKNPAEKKELEDELAITERIKQALNTGNPESVRSIVISTKVPLVPLISAKKSLIIANISEDEIESYQTNPHYQALTKRFGAEHVIPVCVRTAYELSQLNDADAQEMMDMLGLKEKSLDMIIRKTYENLGLITFFTCGPKEAHAWPIRKGITVRQAAGEIHSDLERGFICAEVFNCRDLFELGSVAKVKEMGKMRTEGQDYIVRDGDIINVRFNV